MEKDCYQILGVTSTAPEREIKRVYHDLARKMHPDKAADPEEAKRLEEEFAAVTKAYNTLKDPEKRREYDAKRQKESQAAAAGAGAANGAAAMAPVAAAAGKPATVKMGASVDKRVEAGRIAVAERSYNKGMQLANMGDSARAIEFFETAVKNNPDEGRYHARLAQTLMKARRGFTRAVEAATRACELDPYNVEYKMILGQIYERVGSVSLAVKTYENVLKWDAENPEALSRLGTLQPQRNVSFLGRFVKSIKRRVGL